MARVNVYLPDELAEAARAAGLNVSGITQAALAEALDAQSVNRWLDGLATLEPVRVDRHVVEAAVAAAKEEWEED